MLDFLKKMFRKIVPHPNDKKLNELWPMVEKVNELEDEMKSLSDKELQDKTEEFKERYQNGETLDDLLVEVFAVVREAAARVTEMRPYDVQVLGAIVLHQGRIAEMKTGEGKTLVATMPAYLNALTGEGVHIVTVNDYLAERDSEWMGQVYEFLGLEVGVILEDMDYESRKEAYEADIVYGTNNQFGFDYLRDNMATREEELVQGELNFAILDEIDSILIDEARTPLIISGPTENSPKMYYKFARLARKLVLDRDYEVDEKANSVILTDEGIDRVEDSLGINNLYDNQHMDELHHMNQAIKAKELMERDKDYIVKDNEVHIVDEFTGRLMSGRRYSEGLHQAIEAKENVDIQEETQTMASVTFQNFFRMYDKLSGMTGTAVTEAEEFEEIYELDVVAVPTNEPVIREDFPDVIYKNEQAKFRAVVRDIKEKYERGQPVLVGTVAIEKSEQLSRMLKREGIPHEVLNAKYHEREAEIIKNAGQKGSVTIATNMAGRGTDIVLGDGVVELGGLHVIGTERHESRRIDNQLRGRSGRQGDPGSSRFYVSLEDDLMRLFGSDKITSIMDGLGLDEDQPIEHDWITSSISRAQKKVESRNFGIRKSILDYDEVLHKQRQNIYERRRKILLGEDLNEMLFEMAEKWLDDTLEIYIDNSKAPDQWDLEGLLSHVEDFVGEINLELADVERNTEEEIKDKLMAEIESAYEDKRADLGDDSIEELEKTVMLKTVDQKWMDHLQAMNELRQGIGLRAYGQKDPLVEYQYEAFDMYKEMLGRIREDIIQYLFAIEIVHEGEEMEEQRDLNFTHEDGVSAYDLEQMQEEQQQRKEQAQTNSGGEEEEIERTPLRKKEEPGRNDPCPCGSGKKYKKCCIDKDKYGGYE
ncbi:preprotein translocase subunit SecA [Halanaerobacter jeridensis]|uniref:Protein translocase subunit SecA n=1 Tax=Halanaerobacter jeridensis TaxID=706427 RepID=A0A939BRF1_9FIRM|nr:preprotein translocase subunit SecA [Halanaerobacter jeridensis]MBM7557289.1 preprotein translocase subunit SecA [Halanaerobacter jeridensis]